ncbi:M50 family peptidase, partial [Escherichia coli]|nr:M50 family peptidase [Escherichia coli]
ASDADQLAGITPLPAFFWVVLFGLVNLAVLTAGGLMLAGPLLAEAGLT